MGWTGDVFSSGLFFFFFTHTLDSKCIRSSAWFKTCVFKRTLHNLSCQLTNRGLTQLGLVSTQSWSNRVIKMSDKKHQDTVNYRTRKDLQKQKTKNKCFSPT